MHLDWNEVLALQRALQRLHQHAGMDEFPIRLIEAVHEIVDGEISCYTEVEPEANRVRNVSQHRSDQLEALLPVLGELQLQHPHIADYFANGEQRVRMASDYLSVAEWHQRGVYRHFYGPLRCEEQLAFIIPVASGIHLGFVVNRTNRSFTEQHRTQLDLLRQHVPLAFANAAAVSRLRESQSSDRPVHRDHGVIHLRADGSPWFATERADSILERQFHRTNGATLLPEAISNFVREQVRRHARSGELDGHRTALLRGERGMVSVSLTGKADGDGWVLVLRESSPPASGRDLPPRLQRLLRHLLSGDSEKQIATRTGLSPHTVHEYAKRLYRHFGVSGRFELMALFVDGSWKTDT